MDHDRSEEESTHKYTALKLKVLEWSPEAAKSLEGKIPEGSNVYLVLQPCGRRLCTVKHAASLAPSCESFQNLVWEKERRNSYISSQGIRCFPRHRQDILRHDRESREKHGVPGRLREEARSRRLRTS